MLVKEIFRSIQGEGPDVGTPAVFIRLAGCNLACPWCDTDHTGGEELSPFTIADRVVELLTPNKFVVLTGGEPFTQTLSGLLHELVDIHACHVQIETNGTLWHEDLTRYCSGSLRYIDPRPVSIVCSPKDGQPIHPTIFRFAKAIKHVFGAGDPPLFFYCQPINRVWLQPRDDHDPVKNKQNLDACIESCLQYGFRLSLQTHKLLGIQ